MRGGHPREVRGQVNLTAKSTERVAGLECVVIGYGRVMGMGGRNGLLLVGRAGVGAVIGLVDVPVGSLRRAG